MKYLLQKRDSVLDFRSSPSIAIFTVFKMSLRMMRVTALQNDSVSASQGAVICYIAVWGIQDRG